MRALLVSVLASLASGAVLSAPTIAVSNQLSCFDSEPYLQVTLSIDSADVGRPGILYVGAHDPGRTRAQFYQHHWEEWNGAMFPPHRIVREGLASTTLAIPLGRSATVSDGAWDLSGWQLYVGYGALTAADEEKVQRAMDGVAKVKAMYPERKIPAVEADHYRRVMVQENMTQNAKYRHVFTWTSDISYACESGGGN